MENFTMWLFVMYTLILSHHFIIPSKFHKIIIIIIQLHWLIANISSLGASSLDRPYSDTFRVPKLCLYQILPKDSINHGDVVQYPPKVEEVLRVS